MTGGSPKWYVIPSAHALRSGAAARCRRRARAASRHGLRLAHLRNIATCKAQTGRTAAASCLPRCAQVTSPKGAFARAYFWRCFFRLLMTVSQASADCWLALGTAAAACWDALGVVVAACIARQLAILTNSGAKTQAASPLLTRSRGTTACNVTLASGEPTHIMVDDGTQRRVAMLTVISGSSRCNVDTCAAEQPELNGRRSAAAEKAHPAVASPPPQVADAC